MRVKSFTGVCVLAWIIRCVAHGAQTRLNGVWPHWIAGLCRFDGMDGATQQLNHDLAKQFAFKCSRVRTVLYAPVLFTQIFDHFSNERYVIFIIFECSSRKCSTSVEVDAKAYSFWWYTHIGQPISIFGHFVCFDGLPMPESSFSFFFFSFFIDPFESVKYVVVLLFFFK